MNKFTLMMVAACGIASAASSTIQAKYHEPDNTTRVLWDINSRQTIFSAGNYSRLIPLNDGRLMAVAEWAGIKACYSSDEGKTWTAPVTIVENANKVPYCVPDLLQLQDGTILVGFNPRPSTPYTEDRKFGIRCVRSTDNGQTWEGPIYIFDASHSAGEGCWEPHFLQLPSGEIHCYFANEYPFPSSGEQEISLCRSFDNGLTWSEPERVCFRANHRDGMPTAIITDDNEIVVLVEDNGYARGFRATTMRCTLEENWHDCWVDANSSRRHVIWPDTDDENMKYLSAAPYLRKLPTGETIASWQGDQWDRYGWGESRFDMFVAVGDKDARNFTQVSQPFNIPSDSHALWNSINVGNGNDLFCLASIGSPSAGNAINLMKGVALSKIEAAYGTPVINGTYTGESWTKSKAQQIFLGAIESRQRATVDFLYDKDNLYLFANVVDPTIFTDKIDNDGFYLYIDTRNSCDTYPQDGTFRIFFNVNGEVEWAPAVKNKFTVSEKPEGLEHVMKVNKTYFTLEAAIPWSAMGWESVPVGQDMRLNVAVRDRREGALINETIPMTTKNASWTWVPFNLIDDPRAGVESVAAADGAAADAEITSEGKIITVKAATELSAVEAYSVDGRLVGKSLACGTSEEQLTVDSLGIVIVRATCADGSCTTAKLALN